MIRTSNSLDWSKTNEKIQLHVPAMQNLRCAYSNFEIIPACNGQMDGQTDLPSQYCALCSCAMPPLWPNWACHATLCFNNSSNASDIWTYFLLDNESPTTKVCVAAACTWHTVPSAFGSVGGSAGQSSAVVRTTINTVERRAGAEQQVRCLHGPTVTIVHWSEQISIARQCGGTSGFRVSWWCSGWGVGLFDQAVVRSIPGRGVIKTTRSTQPSIHPGKLYRVPALLVWVKAGCAPAASKIVWHPVQPVVLRWLAHEQLIWLNFL